MTTTPILRRVAGAATALSVAVACGACGSGSTGPSDETSSTGRASGFPVTVETEFGDVAVEEKPETVVVIGSPLDVDMLDALGDSAAVYGGWGPEKQALQIAPWVEGLYGEYADDLIADGKPSAEAVAEQEPDLIIYFGAGSPLDQSGYDQLSEIAPTYAYTQLPSYENELDVLGQLTGTTDRVEEVANGIEDDFTEAREKLSGLQGKTFFQGVVTADGIYSVPAAKNFFGALGLKPSDLQPSDDKPQTISTEKLDEIDADVVVLSGEDGPRKKLEDDSRFDRLPAVENGTMVLAGGTETYLSMPTQIGPSSVPFLLGKLVPQLEDSTLNQGS